MKKKQIGIDLGTTHTLAGCVQDDGSVELIDWGHGPLLPSAIAINSKGHLLFGHDAQNIPHINNFKRELGHPHNQFLLSGIEVTARELSALLLKHIKPIIEKKWGAHFEATLSVPVYFSEQARKAILAACQLADITVTRLINEPLAAALATSILNQNKTSPTLILDLGGGTFDVSIVQKNSNHIEILGTAGNCFLGGLDFTEIILELLDEHPQKPLNQLNKQDHFSYAEKIKKCFSSQPVYQDHLIEFNVTHFESAANILLNEFQHYVDLALHDCQISRQAIDHVILVGGATRMTLFKRWVHDYFPYAHIDQNDPETLVVRGTAIYSHMTRTQSNINDLMISEVSTQSIMIKVSRRLGYRLRNTLITAIPKNTPLPFSCTQKLTTIKPYQTSIKLDIYQGESRLFNDNELIGTLTISDIPPSKDVQEIEVVFNYSAHATLTINAKIISSGNHVRVQFNHKDGLFDPLDVENCRKKLDQIRNYL